MINAFRPLSQRRVLIHPPFLPHGVVSAVDQEELRQFVFAIASRHPELAHLARNDLLLYADTVVVNAFYEQCRCARACCPAAAREGGKVEAFLHQLFLPFPTNVPPR